jgi:hypothetical protein
MLRSVKALFFKPGTLLVVYLVAAIFISLQLISFGTHPFVILPGHPDDIMNKPEIINRFIGQRLTDYNNYLIFKYSFFHLLAGANLYDIHPTEHWDYFKYSPTFPLFMGFLAYLPDVAGLVIWNILNALAVFFAIRMLPFNTKSQCILMWFVANDLFSCFSNTQSNGLMCGLMIAAYCCMQRGKPMWATLWLVLATFIKVYGAIGFCLFLFYPDKLKFILYALMWTIIMAALPLLVTPYHTLVWQYHNWFNLMIADASAAYGLSVTGWLYTWFGLTNVKGLVTITGVLLFLLPFIRLRLYRDEVFRLLILASMLIWVIIFNHKAESPTYIIAVAGVGIWYFAMPRAAWRTALLLLVLLFTCLSTTDIFPLPVRTAFIYPYDIKAFPCILVWCVVFAELMLLKPGIVSRKVAEAQMIRETQKRKN